MYCSSSDVIVISLLLWQALGQQQAPGDHDAICRTGDNTNAHIFPSDWEVLVDSYDYSNLFEGSNAPWTDRTFDADTPAQWEQIVGGTCRWSMRTCTFDHNSIVPQDNWIFSQFINYKEANEIFFNITYGLAECRGISGCREFVDLYHYETDAPVSDAQRTNRDNYEPLFGSADASRLQQPAGSSAALTVNLNLLRPEPRTTGFYLGIQDTGTCGAITRMIMFYRVVRGRTQALLTCPDVALPPLNTQSTSTGICACEANASPTSATLQRVCTANSMCNEDQECACDPGYQLSSGNCMACPEGTFKAGVSNSSCLSCPTNSESRGEANAVCQCIPPNIRNPERPGDPCTTPPSSPRLVLGSGGAPQVTQDTIRVCWLPALDSGGLNDLRYNIYLSEINNESQIYNRANPEGIIQTEGGNQTTLCYSVPDIDTQTSYAVVVVSANGVTGDPQTLTDLNEVQDRFIVFFVALGSDLIPATSCSATSPSDESSGSSSDDQNENMFSTTVLVVCSIVFFIVGSVCGLIVGSVLCCCYTKHQQPTHQPSPAVYEDTPPVSSPHAVTAEIELKDNSAYSHIK